MQVIVEIVNYLFDKGVLDFKDREYLIHKGYYPIENLDGCGCSICCPDPFEIDEEHIRQSKIEEQHHRLELELENKRPVTRKPKRRFKKKKLEPKHAKEKVVKETLSSIENISWRPPLTINTHGKHLEILINKFFFHEKVAGSRKGVFNDVGLFWDWAYQKMEGEVITSEYYIKKLEGKTFSADYNDLIKIFIIFSEEIISRMERQRNKRTDDYIRPAAFFELLEIPEVVRDRWSLRVQLRDGNQLQITDTEGRFVFER